jgi:hypothetical protein
MKEYFFAVFLTLLVVIGLGWVFLANDTAQQKVFSPVQESIRRQTFEQSKAYRQGLVQELQNMQFEYIQADPAHKSALAAIIKHRAADVPADDLPYDLRIFIKELP